ncbi:MAG: response regulator [Actinomycetota bacterium]|nr:response regulator [Actinomycetota bacterium]
MAEVLVVEDDETTRLLLESRLEHAGHRVHTAASVAEAHDVLRRGGAPDVVVSDMFMPGGSGLNLVASLREDPACADLPVIFLSGRALPGDVEAGRAMGGAYLTKPFTMPALTAAIEAALSAGDSALEGAVRARLDDLGDLGSLADRELFADLLTRFVHRAPVLTAEVERAVAARDAGLLEVRAHQLAGSAAELGAVPLARWCTELQTRGREGAMPVPVTVTAALRRELAATCRVFTALARTLAPAQP